MKIIFAGFRHSHIESLYKIAKNNQNIEIIACFEEDKLAQAVASKKLGIIFDCRNYEDILTDDADIVAIGACYGDRGGMIIKALEANKHIISDKPICTSIEELVAIKELVKKSGKKLGCMLDLRYMPSTQRAKEILKSRRLGEIRNISFSGQHYIDYENRPLWYFEKGKHGGTINDIAIHGLDLIRELSGLEILKVDAARCWNSYASKTPEFLDSAIFMAELTNHAGLIADVSYSAPSQAFSMPTYWNFKIWCERGLLTFNATESVVRVFEQSIQGCQEFEGIWQNKDCLDDLITEIENDTSTYTNGVLIATEQALKIQAFSEGITTPKQDLSN